MEGDRTTAEFGFSGAVSNLVSKNKCRTCITTCSFIQDDGTANDVEVFVVNDDEYDYADQEKDAFYGSVPALSPPRHMTPAHPVKCPRVPTFPNGTLF